MGHIGRLKKSMNTPTEKKVTQQITITIYDDNTLTVKAPTDFLLFREIMCLAETSVIKQKRLDHEKQDKIVKPSLQDIMSMGRKN